MSYVRLGAPLAAVALLSFAAMTNAFAASAEHGKAVFMQKGCWECHGTMGQGAATGPRLAPNPIPYDALANFLRTTSRAMPPVCGSDGGRAGSQFHLSPNWRGKTSSRLSGP